MRWSPPEQNARSPAPVSTITPISGSSCASLKARVSSLSVVGRKALRTSGRLIVSFAMPSALWYRMSSNLPADFHAMALGFVLVVALVLGFCFMRRCSSSGILRILARTRPRARAVRRAPHPGRCKGWRRRCATPCRARWRRISRRARRPSPAPASRAAKARRARGAGSRCRRREATPQAAPRPGRGAARASPREGREQGPPASRTGDWLPTAG